MYGRPRRGSIQKGLDLRLTVTVQMAKDLFVEGDLLGFVPDPDDGALDGNLVFHAVHGVNPRSLSKQRRNFSTEGSLNVRLTVVLVSHKTHIEQAVDCSGMFVTFNGFFGEWNVPRTMSPAVVC